MNKDTRKDLKKFGFSTENQVYVVAEIGLNHGGNIETAKQLIESATRANVDAVKFQAYITEKRAPEGNQAVFDIFKKCELPFDAFHGLKEHAAALNVDFFATAFDEESVQCLEEIGCEYHKIASFDIVNHQLLSMIASTGKPAILSTGMATFEEISAACEILNKGTNHISLLHCISSYPTKPKDANLSVIGALRNEFPDYVIGHSDHTGAIKAPLYAAAAGAQILEKHFKIDENMNCVDAPVSITETQMAELVKEVREIELLLGSSTLELREAEEGTTPFRRYSQI